MKTYIIVNTQFTAIHNWPDCNIAEVDFLIHPHRHIFHVQVKCEVFHDNREIEFIQLKNRLNNYLSYINNTFIGSKSCEMIAKDIAKFVNDLIGQNVVKSVRVLEDGENGGEIEF